MSDNVIFKPVNEIEVEIKNMKFLASHLQDQIVFTKLINRFIRNAEALYDTVLFNRDHGAERTVSRSYKKLIKD